MLSFGRRRFVSLISATSIAALAAVGAYAQTGRVYRVGVLETVSADRNRDNLDALLRGLRERGYVEGQNLRIEYRSADGRAERFLDLATELVHLPVDLIVTRGTPAAKAAQAATEMIPTVMAAIADAFARIANDRFDALSVGIDALTQVNAKMIVELAAAHKLLTAYPAREFVDVGGLLSYGPSYPDLYYRSAGLIDKIFKGAKPSEVPVEQPTKLELVVNLQTAKALGLEIPPNLMVRADEVIE